MREGICRAMLKGLIDTPDETITRSYEDNMIERNSRIMEISNVAG